MKDQCASKQKKKIAGCFSTIFFVSPLGLYNMRGFLKPSERVFFPNPGTWYREENLYFFPCGL